MSKWAVIGIWALVLIVGINTGLAVWERFGDAEPEKVVVMAPVELASLGLTLVEDPVGDSALTYYESLPQPDEEQGREDEF